MARKQSSPVKYAPKVDIFGNLVNSFDKNARQMERSGIRDIQEGQFGEQMELKRDAFAEAQAQNEFNQGIANARLGLARQASARAAAAAGRILTPGQKAKLKREDDRLRLQQGTYYKSRPSYGKSGKGSAFNMKKQHEDNMEIFEIDAEESRKLLPFQSKAWGTHGKRGLNAVNTAISNKVDEDWLFDNEIEAIPQIGYGGGFGSSF